MRITVIGNYGAGNLGDEAILYALKRLIYKKYPSAEIDVMGAGKLLPLGARSFVRALFDWKLWKGPLSILKRADTVIIGGGGLFTDEESWKGTILWSLHGIVAQMLGKPVKCIGISVGKIGLVNKVLTKFMMRRCESIVVRDKQSKETLKSWGIESTEAPDLVLSLSDEFAEEETLQKENKYVVVNVRSFSKDDEFLIKLFVRTVNFLSADLRYRVILLPLSEGGSNDSTILNNILVQTQENEYVSIYNTTQYFPDIVKLIRNSELMITTRLHGGIFSILSGVPIVQISYMDKVKNFWSSTALGVEPISVSELTFEMLQKSILSTLQNSDRYRGALESYKSEFDSKFSGVLEYI